MKRVRVTLTMCVALLAAASGGAPEFTVLGYLGGSGTDDCDGIAMDPAGAVYLACHSDSPDFPPLCSGQASRQPGNMDAVVVKLEARTRRVAWITSFISRDPRRFQRSTLDDPMETVELISAAFQRGEIQTI